MQDVTDGVPRNRSKSTQRFDPEKLAVLTKQASGELPIVAPDAAVVEAIPPDTAAPPPIAMPRAMTVEDPITTQLLAEVARTHDTLDFDEHVIEDAVEKLGDGEKAHPHTRRRTR
jgi:hypothetical protein